MMFTTKKNWSRMLATALVLTLSAGVSQAGFFSTSAWNNDATSGIVAGGNYTHAYNFGAATNPVINGVNFTGIGGANPSVGGQFSTTGLGNVLNGDTNNVTGAAGSQLMATDFVYNGFPATVTISGLTPNSLNRATFYSVDWDGGPGVRQANFSAANTPTLLVDQGQFGANNGIRVTYDFAADNTGSSTITATPTALNSFHFYGFASQTLPSVPITGLFNTGVDNGGTPLANGANDTHYSILELGPQAAIAAKAGSSAPIPPWIGDNATSDWIREDTNGNQPVAVRTYETTFVLANNGIANPLGRLVGLIAADNSATIKLNGVAVGTTYSGFGAFIPFDIFSNAFQPGLNSLQFILTNAGGAPNPAGLRVEFTSAIVQVPEPSSLVLLGVGLAGLLALRRHKRAS